jgi:hypothetical protein
MRLGAGASRTTTAFVVLPRDAFPEGVRHVRFRVADGERFTSETHYNLVGPDREDMEDHEDRGEAPGR